MFSWDDVSALVDQEVVMLRAVSRDGDPVELTDQAATDLASWILAKVEPPEAPAGWKIGASEEQVDLYRELAEQPRSLSAAEAQSMVLLVDAWRAHEHRKHLTLKRALAKLAD